MDWLETLAFTIEFWTLALIAVLKARIVRARMHMMGLAEPPTRALDYFVLDTWVRFVKPNGKTTFAKIVRIEADAVLGQCSIAYWENWQIKVARNVFFDPDAKRAGTWHYIGD